MTWNAPADANWTYASRRLIPSRFIAVAAIAFLPAGAAVALGIVAGGWAWSALAVVAGASAWVAWIIFRQVTAHAWAERDEDLVIKRGRLFRSMVVVPYGRMQYVEVSAGPVARAFGIARVQLHTASPGTDAHLAGVPTEEAARLRDRLTTRGEARLAGL